MLKNACITSPPSPYEIVAAEIVVFRACNGWAEAECSQQGLEPSGENKREVLGDSLFLIDFPGILGQDLVKVVFPSNILNKEEKLSLLEKKYGAQNSKAPLKFLPERKLYQIPIPTYPEATAVRIKEYSIFDKKEIQYDFIKIKPTGNLLLTGILLAGCPGQTPTTKHEVIIECNTEEKAWSQLIVCNSLPRKTLKYVRKYLELKDVLLKANRVYSIKVSHPGTMSNTAEQIRPLKYIMSTKPPDMINLKVTNYFSNRNIICLTVRLV